MKARLILLVFFIVAGLFAGCARETDSAKGREVAALVNGVRIYFEDVNSEYASLNLEERKHITKSDALSFLIEREILRQEAVREGIKATDKEIEEEYAFYLLLNNVTEPDLAGRLAMANSSVRRFKESLERQIMINKLVEKRIPRSFVLKHEDVMAVYNASRFPELGVSFERVEKALIDLITAEKQKAERTVYIEGLKNSADVLIVAVPG